MKVMSSEDRLLFICTRQNFLEMHRDLVTNLCFKEDVEWNTVYSISEEHRVAPLIYFNLKQCQDIISQIPKDVIDKFEYCLFQNAIMKDLVKDRIVKVLACLNEMSIDTMLIKGVILDKTVYRKQFYTMLGDVDLIARPKSNELPTKDRKKITNVIREIPIFEFEYFAHHDITMNATLPINFDRIWQDSEIITFGDQRAFMMSSEDLLISACISSCRRRYFKLKNILDIAEILETYHDLKWDLLLEKSKEYRCDVIVYTALLITQMTLGCNLPREIFRQLGVDPLRVLMIKYLIQKITLSSLSIFSAKSAVGRRKIDRTLLLPYLTYRWDQAFCHLKAVLRYRHCFDGMGCKDDKESQEQ
jgi:hypothetical protein